jgi:acetyl esterase/lipase
MASPAPAVAESEPGVGAAAQAQAQAAASARSHIVNDDHKPQLEPELASIHQTKSDEQAPFYLPRITRFQLASYTILIFGIKALDRFFFRVGQLVRRPPPSERPTYIKSYPAHPKLKHSFFIPTAVTAGKDEDQKFPVYIDVHGGGFSNGRPEMDHKFSAAICERYQMIVIALRYSHAPRYKYPVAIHQVRDAIKAILKDDSLPIDHDRVILGGFSAGANLSLAAAQDSELTNNISALIAWYPVVDFTEETPVKLARKPEKYAKDFDILSKTGHLSVYSYLSMTTDCRSPTISPTFANPKDLPEYVYIIGAEKDMLCSEAEILAEKLAKHHSESKPSQRTSIEGFEVKEGWREGPVCWELAKEKNHGFADGIVWFNKKLEQERAEFCEAIYERINQWLEQVAWKK